MTPEQFCYWLQGRVELVTEPPTADQWKSIGEHLALTFKKVTPPLQAPPSPSPSPLDLQRAMRHTTGYPHQTDRLDLVAIC